MVAIQQSDAHVQDRPALTFDAVHGEIDDMMAAYNEHGVIRLKNAVPEHIVKDLHARAERQYAELGRRASNGEIERSGRGYDLSPMQYQMIDVASLFDDFDERVEHHYRMLESLMETRVPEFFRRTLESEVTYFAQCYGRQSDPRYYDVLRRDGNYTGFHQDVAALIGPPKGFTGWLALMPTSYRNSTVGFVTGGQEDRLETKDGFALQDDWVDAVPAERLWVPESAPGDLYLFGFFTVHFTYYNLETKQKRFNLEFRCYGEGPELAPHFRGFPRIEYGAGPAQLYLRPPVEEKASKSLGRKVLNAVRRMLG